MRVRNYPTPAREEGRSDDVATAGGVAAFGDAVAGAGADKNSGAFRARTAASKPVAPWNGALFNRIGCDGETFDVAKLIGDLLSRADLGEQLVVIDDADEMDIASQQVLGYVMRRKVSPRIRHVLTVDSLGDSSAFSGIPSITLEPLPARMLIRIGPENLPSTPSYMVLNLVARASAVSPLVSKSILGEISMKELTDEVQLSVPLKPGTAQTASV